MDTLIVAVLSFVGFIAAYHTYGRWLSRKIFNLNPAADVPSHQLRDDVDFVPTKKSVIFGHHFTSIAGTGPIVGPAIAVFWGWLPALLWVLLGSIFIGAVHDFSALVVSLRNRGQTLGEVAGRIMTPRARVLFLLILFLALTVVLAIFGLVIALIFAFYPESVLPVWISMPLALGIGYWVYKRGGNLLVPSLLALATIYGCVYVGAYHVHVDIGEMLNMKLLGPWPNVVILWTFVLLIYCFVAAVLPVWVLLQPRDYINSHQLVVALVLLVGGLAVAGLSGKATLSDIPAVAAKESIPADAPPIFPFLFITIACGACSGFHCLVSSGTTSKQIAQETDAQYVGYGAMLLEGGLAVIVILACCAGLSMGQFQLDGRGAQADWKPAMADNGQQVTGIDAWHAKYKAGWHVEVRQEGSRVTSAMKSFRIDTNQFGHGQKDELSAAVLAAYPNSDVKVTGGWAAFQLKTKVGAFIEGGANFLSAIGIPLKLGIGIVAVLVSCFAATTLDTATRLQRYVIQELAGTMRIKPLTNKYLATGMAAGLGCLVALIPASPQQGPGSGGLILWPLFGAVNQLLAGLALMVTVFYLWRRSKPIAFAAIPMCIMLVMPAWAMLHNMFSDSGWLAQGDYLLFGFGLAVMSLQVWMVVEGLLLWPRAHGMMEEALPPLDSMRPQVATASGRSC